MFTHVAVTLLCIAAHMYNPERSHLINIHKLTYNAHAYMYGWHMYTESHYTGQFSVRMIPSNMYMYMYSFMYIVHEHINTCHAKCYQRQGLE